MRKFAITSSLLYCLHAVAFVALLWTAPASANDVYVVTDHGQTIRKIDSTGQISTFVTGLANVQDITFDRQGNLFASVLGDDTIKKITPTGGISTFATGFLYPGVLAFDGSGNLFVGDFNDNSIKEVTPSGIVSTYLSGVEKPLGIAVDPTGTLFFGNAKYSTPTDGLIWKVDGVNHASLLTHDQELFIPSRLAFGPDNDLYVSNNADSILRVTSTGAITSFAAISLPVGIGFDDSGDLFVASTHGNVQRVTPMGVTSLFATGLDTPSALAIAPSFAPEPSSACLLATILLLSSAVFVRRLSGNQRR